MNRNAPVIEPVIDEPTAVATTNVEENTGTAEAVHLVSAAVGGGGGGGAAEGMKKSFIRKKEMSSVEESGKKQKTKVSNARK